MHGKQQFSNSLFCTTSRAATLALTMAIVFALMVVATQSAQAQTYNVLYNFTGGLDGAEPYSGLTMDRAGNLYGTTSGGGQFQGYCQYGGCGTVFKLSRAGSGWTFSPLYAFLGVQQGDGYNPYGADQSSVRTALSTALRSRAA